MDLRIDTPILLLLFIPVAAYFFYVWKKHHASWKKVAYTAFWLRVVAIACLIIALTNPYILLPVEDEQVIFLVDRSASAKHDVNQSVEFINEALKSKENHHAAGIYSFSNSVQTDAILSKELQSVPVLTTMKAENQTNIEEAIKIAKSIAGTTLPTRIVLLSDGNETKGEALNQANLLKNSKLSIDVVPIEKSAKQDVLIEQFETPQVAYEGEQQQFVVTVHSDIEQQATIVLYENNAQRLSDQVTLQQGSNRFTLNHVTAANGLIKYDVQVLVEEDALLENNKLTSVTTIQAAPKLLVVQSERSPSAIPQIIGNDTISTTLLNSENLPTTLSSYLPYQAIIFDNVPAHEVGEAKMAIIEQAVKHFGTGFMMVGGEQSFGLGGYYKTPIENVLPVVMDVQGEKEMPSLGLVLVIDRSGSMDGNKMTLAKEAAARSIDLLRDDDTLGVIAFDDRPWEVVKTAVLTDKEDAKEKVLSIPVGGGTEIYNALNQAYESLDDLKLQRKHVILLTDGYGNMNADYKTLATDYAEKGITLSTVAIGQDSDRALLESLSIAGLGRFYDVVDETTIPSILSRETSMMTRTYIVDEPFYPTIYNVEEWNSLFVDGVAEMNAYIASTAKPLATVIAESDEEDPILTSWQYGLGTSLAFASDSRGAWAGDWARWANWKPFWQKAIAELLPEYHDVSYGVTSQGNGQYTITDVTNEAAFLDVVAVDEKGRELQVQSDVRSASQLSITVEGDPGLIFLSVKNKDGEVQKLGVQLPYSDEYKLVDTNSKMLEQLATTANGKLLTSPGEVFRPFETKGFEQQLFAQWLVFIAMLLFFSDITLRRFGFPTYVKKGKKVVEEAPSSEPTYGSLLKKLKNERK